MPSVHTCDGININPPLQISGVDSKAKSMILAVDDPDAPAGTWTHWVVFNIPPDVSYVAEGQNPPGVIGVNSWGETRYNGPCPPFGQHRYFFKLYVLDCLLDLSEGASKHEVEKAMIGHVVDRSEFIGIYGR